MKQSASSNSINLSNEICQAFTSLFQGRADAWGGIEGLCHHEQVTPNHYLKHLKGENSLGIYPLLDDGTCYWAAIDLDVKDWNKALAIRKTLTDKGIFAHIAESKRKGYHIYVFALDRFVAKDIRRILLHTVKNLQIKAEIFPKRDEVDKVVPYSNYLNIPYYGHTRPFLNLDLIKIPLKIFLQRVKRIPNEAIINVLKDIPETEEPPLKARRPKGRQKRHRDCMDKILQGVTEPGRDEAAFALARYYIDDLDYSSDTILGILEEWDKRNNPPLGDERLLEIKVKSAEKGYKFGCKSIIDNANLSKFCVGIEECEWLRERKGITLDGTSYYQRDNGIFSSHPSKKEDGLPIITTLASFAIEPRLRIEMVDEDERLDTLVKIGRGDYPVIFRKSAFNSKKQLLAALPQVDLQYYGNDKDTQAILGLLTKEGLPKRRGTTVLGRNGDLWVLRDSVISNNGVMDDPELSYIPSGVEFDRRVHYPTPMSKDTQDEVISQLIQLNNADVILPILGWFFATPFIPQIREKLGHFPILSIWGTHGAGKSSLLRLLWELFGVKSELYSATETPFTFLKLFSGSSSIPLIIDEFKPYSMQDNEVKLLVRLLRRIYDGDIETRGHPDQTITAYHLQAPTVISGEVAITTLDSAMVERAIQVNMNPDTLSPNSSCVEAYNNLTKLKLGGFALPYIQWCLGSSIDELISEARELLPKDLQELPLRVSDNILVILLGLVALNRFGGGSLLTQEAVGQGVKDAIKATKNELFEKGSYQIALTTFLEQLATMAQTERIKWGIHYTTDDNKLYIHLADCLAEFRKFIRDTNPKIEVVDELAYRRQVREIKGRNGYVTDTWAQKWFNRYEDGRGKKRRCVEIDMSKLPFDISGFEKPEQPIKEEQE